MFEGYTMLNNTHSLELVLYHIMAFFFSGAVKLNLTKPIPPSCTINGLLGINLTFFGSLMFFFVSVVLISKVYREPLRMKQYLSINRFVSVVFYFLMFLFMGSSVIRNVGQECSPLNYFEYFYIAQGVAFVGIIILGRVLSEVNTYFQSRLDQQNQGESEEVHSAGDSPVENNPPEYSHSEISSMGRDEEPRIVQFSRNSSLDTSQLRVERRQENNQIVRGNSGINFSNDLNHLQAENGLVNLSRSGSNHGNPNASNTNLRPSHGSLNSSFRSNRNRSNQNSIFGEQQHEQTGNYDSNENIRRL